MLGTSDTPHPAVHVSIAEAAVNDDGTTDGLAGRLQQLAAAISNVDNLLRRRNVGRVLLQDAELCQRKVLG